MVNAKQNVLMIPLTMFFSNDKNMQKLLDVVNEDSNSSDNVKISLRILDWFVTNYSKKNNIIYDLNGSQFIVYLDYKSQLKAYSKKQFDPFCRRERINFEYKKGKHIETTVGQLNFFRWLIQNNVIDYVKNNLNDIETDMNNSIRHLYKKKSDGKEDNEKTDKKRRKRHELSISATKTISKHNVQIMVEFE